MSDIKCPGYMLYPTGKVAQITEDDRLCDSKNRPESVVRYDSHCIIVCHRYRLHTLTAITGLNSCLNKDNRSNVQIY